MTIQHLKYLDLFYVKFHFIMNQANYNMVIHIHDLSDYFFIIFSQDNLQKIFHLSMHHSEYVLKYRHSH